MKIKYQNNYYDEFVIWREKTNSHAIYYATVEMLNGNGLLYPSIPILVNRDSNTPMCKLFYDGIKSNHNQGIVLSTPKEYIALYQTKFSDKFLILQTMDK